MFYDILDHVIMSRSRRSSAKNSIISKYKFIDADLNQNMTMFQGRHHRIGFDSIEIPDIPLNPLLTCTTPPTSFFRLAIADRKKEIQFVVANETSFLIKKTENKYVHFELKPNGEFRVTSTRVKVDMKQPEEASKQFDLKKFNKLKASEMDFDSYVTFFLYGKGCDDIVVTLFMTRNIDSDFSPADWDKNLLVALIITEYFFFS